MTNIRITGNNVTVSLRPEQTCPPCSGNCLQGDECPEEMREPMAQRDAWIAIALVTVPWAVACLSVWAWRTWL